MAAPHPAAGTVIDLYRRHAEEWSRARDTVLTERAWLDPFLAHVPSGAHLLDIGCGAGIPIGRHLVGGGYALTGIDSSPEMIGMFAHNCSTATGIVADMRDTALGRPFAGLIAWDSFFHLAPDDQRAMFPVFGDHAAPGAPLMFTSGPAFGEAIGKLQGEPLYHASLDPNEYRTLLADNGFEILTYAAEDPDCTGHTVWLARRL